MGLRAINYHLMQRQGRTRASSEAGLGTRPGTRPTRCPGVLRLCDIRLKPAPLECLFRGG